MGLSKSYFGVGNVAGAAQENKQKACEYYDLSLKVYNKGKTENPNAEMPMRTGVKDMPEMIEAFRRKQGC